MTGDVTRVTPLTSRRRELDRVGAGEVVLASQVSLRVDEAGAFEVGLPIEPNTWIALGDREALWLGPDEWLVTSEAETPEAVGADLAARLKADRAASIVDVSANRVAIELSGSDRLGLLAAGCGLDLHPRSWRPGRCAQTLLANVAVLLQERDAETRVFLRPSFAGHLVTWFERVAADR